MSKRPSAYASKYVRGQARSVLPLFFWRRCMLCGLESRWLRMWKVWLKIPNARVTKKYVCQDCGSTDPNMVLMRVDEHYTRLSNNPPTSGTGVR